MIIFVNLSTFLVAGGGGGGGGERDRREKVMATLHMGL